MDGETAFTGGINISSVYRNSSFTRKRRPTPKEGWRDTHVQVSGPIVEEFQELFFNTWEKRGCAPNLGKVAYFPRQERRGDKSMRLVAADPAAGRSEFYVVLLPAIDGVWSSIGSTNLDWRSFVHNYEADLLILDPVFSKEMEGLFQADEKASHEMSLAEWRQRGLLLRMQEWIARCWEYLF